MSRTVLFSTFSSSEGNWVLNSKIAGTRPIIIKKVTKSKGKKNIFVKNNVFPLTT